jgi:hypothetical protein
VTAGKVTSRLGYGTGLSPDCETASLTGLAKAGGEGGIRTPGRLAPTRDFQSRTIDHSVTSPEVRRMSPRGGLWLEPLASVNGKSNPGTMTVFPREWWGGATWRIPVEVLQVRLPDSFADRRIRRNSPVRFAARNDRSGGSRLRLTASRALVTARGTSLAPTSPRPTPSKRRFSPSG